MLTTHGLHPQWSAARISRALGAAVPPTIVSDRQCRRIITAGAITVQLHGAPVIYGSDKQNLLLRLLRGDPVRGTELKDGTRRDRHTLPEALAIINQDEKEHIMSEPTARRICKQRKVVYRIRRYGPGVTDLNNEQRQAWEHRHRRRTKRQWQEICWSDSTTVANHHCPNRRNSGIWVNEGDKVPSIHKYRRPASQLHVYGVCCRYGFLGPVFIEGGINAKVYINKVLKVFIPQLQRLFGDEKWI